MYKESQPIYGPCYARHNMQCPHDKRYVDQDIICVACSENGTKQRLIKGSTITNIPPMSKKTHPGGNLTSITAGAAPSPSYTHISNLMAPHVQGKDAGRRLFLPGEHVSQRNRDQLNIKFNYDEKIIEKIKEECTGKWNPKEKLWTVPLTAENIENLKVMGFRIPADVTAPEPAKPLVVDHNFHESLYNPRAVELYEHQKKYGVSVLGQNHFACLYWDCGVGKTLPMVMVVQHIENNKEKLPALIVCPAGVIDSWKEEFAKFTEVKPVILAGTPAKRKKLIKSNPDGVFICSYDVMTNDCTMLVELKLRLVCFDEMQYLRNTTTSRVEAAINLTAYIPNRYGLTGTPIGNSPLDIFAQMLIIQPSIFGPSQAAFRTKYFTNNGFSFINKKGKKIQTQDWHPKPGALDQIREKISAVCHRLTKEEALPDLPPKTFQVIKVPMSDEQRAIYNAIKTEARFKIAGAENKHIEKGAQLIRLLQVCGGHIGNAEKYELIPHNKIKELRRLWEDSGRRPMVVWVRFTPDLWEIEKEFATDGIVTFHGKNSREKNTENRHLFQSGKANIIVVQETTGGTGITLTRGNFVVTYGQGHSALIRAQKIDRTHRPGQKNKVLYIDLVCENSKELEVLEVVEKYREMSAEMLGDNAILNRVMENL